MTSPDSMPADAAGLPDSTASTTAPDVLESPTETPRNAPEEVVEPEDEDPLPASNDGSALVTVSLGIANPMFCAGSLVLPVATAVLMPTTCPLLSTSGPPLLPGLIAASVCSRPERFSSESDSERFLAEMMPSVTDGEPPYPSALPTAITLSPTAALEDEANVAGVRFETPDTLMTARSAVASRPTID